MRPLLYFWRGDNYRRDLDYGAGFHLNQASPRLHEIDVGDSLWAFTRWQDGAYVLAADLVAKAKTFNPPGYRYGRYRLWGDLARSRYFSVAGQPDITHLIRSLSIAARGDQLGRAFQGHAAVRRLAPSDDIRLRAFAATLPLEPRARLLPEERLEALLLAGDALAVSALIRDEPSGLANERRQYLQTEAIRRNRAFVDEIRDLYSGRCQLCGWAPRTLFRVDLFEAHHIRWLGRGGEDSMSNLVLLCPNHHRAIHRLDAPLDFERNGFVLSGHVHSLELLAHDLAA